MTVNITVILFMYHRNQGKESEELQKDPVHTKRSHMQFQQPGSADWLLWCQPISTRRLLKPRV